MKQIIQNTQTGKVSIKEVPSPKAAPREILVRTNSSLISPGTERMLVDFANKSLMAKSRARPDLVRKVIAKAKVDGIAETIKTVMSRLDQPLPLGYSASGTVVEVGAELEGSFRTGDRVAIAGAGIANHAEFNAVPRNLAAIIPEGTSDEEACYGTLSSIALHAVRNVDSKLGETVAVVGLGLIGQLVCQLLRLAGARAIAIDFDKQRLEVADSLGAELSINPEWPDAVEQVMSHTSRKGCDGIIIAAATSSNQPFEFAAAVARDRAKVCMVGLTGTKFPYAPFMQKELSVVVSRSYGPGRYDDDYEGRDVKYPEGFIRWTETDNLAECLRLMSPSLAPRLDVKPLTSHRFDFNEAEKGYSLIMEKSEPHLGVVLTYPNQKEKFSDTPIFSTPKIKTQNCVLGVIGAGNFTRNILLPELSKVPGVTLHTIVSRKGITASHSQEKYGFINSGSSEKEIFNNPAINAVVVTTRHDSHAQLTSEALLAGKSVLVEKPLGLNLEEISVVRQAREKADGFFQIGFNRRFAPLSIKAKTRLISISSPKFMLFRINAGPISKTSWINSSIEGGGRIIGEVCHFIDLARFFADSPIVSVMADTPSIIDNPGENVMTTIRFEDGSLAAIAYTSLGDAVYPKENYEIFAGGTVINIDNFRSLMIASGGTTHRSTKRLDKGFGGSLRAFVAAVNAGGPSPLREEELMETSCATIAVVESLRSGKQIDL